jgi:hypothetical protein
MLGDFILCSLGRLFLPENIRESLEPKDQRGVLCVDLGLALEATRDAWARFGHGDATFAALSTRLLAAARVAGCLPLYDWLDGIVLEWLSAAATADARLMELFHHHDADQSGVCSTSSHIAALPFVPSHLDTRDKLLLTPLASLQSSSRQ